MSQDVTERLANSEPDMQRAVLELEDEYGVSYTIEAQYQEFESEKVVKTDAFGGEYTVVESYANFVPTSAYWTVLETLVPDLYDDIDDGLELVEVLWQGDGAEGSLRAVGSVYNFWEYVNIEMGSLKHIRFLEDSE